jgi:Integrase
MAFAVCRNHTATGGPSGLKLNSLRGSLWLHFEREMDMRKVGGGRNFGWGKQMEWAGKQALRAAFGGGHYGTVASHTARWRKFCEWSREQGVRDARDVSSSELAQFAEHLSQQTGRGISNGYAKNQLTSVNVALESLRGDRALWVRPSDYIGQRSSVRTDAPVGLDRNRLQPVIERLVAQGKERVVAVAMLCREFGLRRKEASLLDLRLASHQAGQLGRINVVAGTKGGRGRSVDRWVPATDAGRHAIQFAERAAEGNVNLVPADRNLAQWLTYVSKHWSRSANSLNGGSLRDLRAAYACDRYTELTKAPAPVIAGQLIANTAVDQAARQVLSQELGHRRTTVLVSYIGSSR